MFHCHTYQDAESEMYRDYARFYPGFLPEESLADHHFLICKKYHILHHFCLVLKIQYLDLIALHSL